MNTEIAKPFPNEHAARQRPPGDFEPDSFRRVSPRGAPDGISFILGRLRGQTSMTLQSVRFDREKFTPAQAKAWLKENDLSSAGFEEATKKGFWSDVI